MNWNLQTNPRKMTPKGMVFAYIMAFLVLVALVLGAGLLAVAVAYAFFGD